MQDLVLYETVTFLVELPCPVKNRELSNHEDNYMTIAQLRNETPMEDMQHKTNAIFPFRTWMCLTPGKLASFDKLGKAKVNKCETTQIHFSLTFTLLSS